MFISPPSDCFPVLSTVKLNLKIRRFFLYFPPPCTVGISQYLQGHSRTRLPHECLNLVCVSSRRVAVVLAQLQTIKNIFRKLYRNPPTWFFVTAAETCSETLSKQSANAVNFKRLLLKILIFSLPKKMKTMCKCPIATAQQPDTGTAYCVH